MTLSKGRIAGSMNRTPLDRHLFRISNVLARNLAGDEPRLTFAQLIEELGTQSHMVVILFFCALNMLPGPPGFGGTIAITIFVLALTMVLGRPIRLPRFIGERRVPRRMLQSTLKRLKSFSRQFGRFSSPRLEILATEATNKPLGIIIMLMCLPMVVPIPFMNAIPNVGLTIMCLSRLNHDGTLMGAGFVVGVIGVVIDLAVIITLVTLAMNAGSFF